MHAIPTPSLLSDALERAYSNNVFSHNRPVSVRALMNKAGKNFSCFARGAGRFVANIINAQAEARARDQRYSRTPW